MESRVERRILVTKVATGTVATATPASSSSAGDVETGDHCHVFCCEDWPDDCGDACVFETCWPVVL